MIAELAYQELEPGSLARLFGAGCAAVLVRCPDVVAGLWRGLLEDRAEQMPWEAPLVGMEIGRAACRERHWPHVEETESAGCMIHTTRHKNKARLAPTKN